MIGKEGTRTGSEVENKRRSWKEREGTREKDAKGSKEKKSSSVFEPFSCFNALELESRFLCSRSTTREERGNNNGHSEVEALVERKRKDKRREMFQRKRKERFLLRFSPFPMFLDRGLKSVCFRSRSITTGEIEQRARRATKA